MKRTLTLFVALAAASLFAVQVPKEVVVGAAAKKQPEVKFSHEKHTKLVKSCETCHHMQKGLTAESKEVTRCTTCHLDPKDKAGSMREMSLSKNPFHAQCIACHKEQKKGPTACTGCHIKKS
jgi:hypothetical protein